MPNQFFSATIPIMTDALLGELTDVLNGLRAPNRVWQGSIQTQVFTEILPNCNPSSQKIHRFHFRSGGIHCVSDVFAKP
jgi:hypothetical protein